MADRYTNKPANQIKDRTLKQLELDITNTPTDGDVLKINMPTGDFTAIAAPSVVDLTATVAVNQTNIVLNAFRIAIDASRSIFNMVDGIVDYFNDETGIDTANSTNEDYDAANDLYKPTTISVDAFAHYKCNDDAANTTVTDDGTGANNGVGNVNTSNYSVVGKINDAFDFNGSSEYVNLDALATDIASDTSGSISIWVNSDSFSPTSKFLSITNSTVATQLVLGFNTSGNLSAFYAVAGVRVWDIQNATVYSTGVWYHIVLVQDGTSPKLYVNSVDVTNITAAVQPTYWFNNATINSMRLGCRDYNSGGNTLFFNGKVDDARYYQNKALTQTEIDVIYNSGSGTEAEIPGTTYNITLISDTITAETEPDDARIVILQEDVDAVTINTDLKAYLTRDAGQTFTTDFGTDDKLDITSHGFVNDDRIMVTSSSQDLPVGLDSATVYYVVNKTTNDFELSLTSSGAAVDITDNGTGTHTAKKVSVVTLSDDGNFDASKKILTGSADISAQPSGTTMEYSIISFNEKDLKIHSSALNWE